MSNKLGQTVGVEAKQSIGDQVLNRMDSLADALESAAERVHTSLSALSSQSTPRTEDDCRVDQEMPPYFHHIRANLDRMESAILSINESIDRLEL